MELSVSCDAGGTSVAPKLLCEAIERDVQSAVVNASSKGGFWGRVAVNGQIIEYRAFPMPNGVINIGTYYPKWVFQDA
jgi:hypothetical protein